MSPLRMVVVENYRRVAFWRAVACEMIGTAMLVFIGCGSIVLQLDPTTLTTPAKTLKIALAFGFAVNILIKTFGPVSGCHINPAVSLAFMIVGKLSVLRAVCYILAQIAGSILAAGFLYGLMPPKFRDHLGNTRILKNVTTAQGFATEAVLAFILVLAISSCLDEKRIDHYKMKITNPLTIGFTVSALHLVGIPFTGASLNPARSFGPALITQKWDHHWVYWAGPITGACLASLTYYFLISPPKKNPPKKAAAVPGLGYRQYSRPSVNTLASVMSTVSETVDVPLETFNCRVAMDIGKVQEN